MKKNIKPIIILSIIFTVAWLGSRFYNSRITQEIKENKYETIAKVYEVKYGAKNVSIKYKYLYKEKIYLAPMKIKLNWKAIIQI